MNKKGSGWGIKRKRKIESPKPKPQKENVKDNPDFENPGKGHNGNPFNPNFQIQKMKN